MSVQRGHDGAEDGDRRPAGGLDHLSRDAAAGLDADPALGTRHHDAGEPERSISGCFDPNVVGPLRELLHPRAASSVRASASDSPAAGNAAEDAHRRARKRAPVRPAHAHGERVGGRQIDGAQIDPLARARLDVGKLGGPSAGRGHRRPVNAGRNESLRAPRRRGRGADGRQGTSFRQRSDRGVARNRSQGERGGRDARLVREAHPHASLRSEECDVGALARGRAGHDRDEIRLRARDEDHGSSGPQGPQRESAFAIGLRGRERRERLPIRRPRLHRGAFDGPPVAENGPPRQPCGGIEKDFGPQSVTQETGPDRLRREASRDDLEDVRPDFELLERKSSVRAGAALARRPVDRPKRRSGPRGGVSSPRLEDPSRPRRLPAQAQPFRRGSPGHTKAPREESVRLHPNERDPIPLADPPESAVHPADRDVVPVLRADAGTGDRSPALVVDSTDEDRRFLGITAVGRPAPIGARQARNEDQTDQGQAHARVSHRNPALQVRAPYEDRGDE